MAVRGAGGEGSVMYPELLEAKYVESHTHLSASELQTIAPDALQQPVHKLLHGLAPLLAWAPCVCACVRVCSGVCGHRHFGFTAVGRVPGNEGQGPGDA